MTGCQLNLIMNNWVTDCATVATMQSMDPNPNPLLLAAINQRIEIQHYDHEWLDRFTFERTRLLQLFPEVFKGIEHFGSTAVPGLAAKPVIDILAGVDSMRVADELL